MKEIEIEQFDGNYKITLNADGDKRKLYIYLDSVDNKWKGLFKDENGKIKDIPEQNIPESEEEWRY